MIPTASLQSEETDIILNTIDELRSIGIGDILELPQIIVCGDQSSGKSSVLNAVSTVKFPTKNALCTRFATEVIMRPAMTYNIALSIVPGPDRTPEEQHRLKEFRPVNISMDDIERLIDEATEAMGIDPVHGYPETKRFSNDILRFEVTGPDQPSLTLVDLPGLFRGRSKYQTEEDQKSVRELVVRYMQNKRSVILAVISAPIDFVLQEVTELSRAVDPQGIRTLGIITKPDLVQSGTEPEKQYIELAENQLYELHHGWHVLVNRDHDHRACTQDERDDREKRILSQGVWARVPMNNKGVFSLQNKLSTLLREQIVEELPDLIKETEEAIADYKARLGILGVSRRTPEERRLYLIRAADTFRAIMHSCINGSYDDRYFYDENDEIELHKRLRAVVQDVLNEYSTIMYEHGHEKHILDTPSAESDLEHPHKKKVSLETFVKEVMKLMKRSRGRELTGIPNPMVVRDLFRTQSKPWVKITSTYRAKILEAVKLSIDIALKHATDQITRSKLREFVIGPALEKLVAAMDAMIEKLLQPRLDSHPITYNRRLVENMREADLSRAQRILEDRYKKVVSTRGEVVSKEAVEFVLLKSQSMAPTAEDLAVFAASEAIEQMRAYYKIAKENMVDNFANLVVEDCLISKLPCLLSPASIANLEDETVNEIAQETEQSAADRMELDGNLALCESALGKLKKLENLCTSALRPTRRQSVSLDESVLVHPSQRPGDSEGQTGTQVSQLDVGFSDEESPSIPSASVNQTSLHTNGHESDSDKDVFARAKKKRERKRSKSLIWASEESDEQKGKVEPDFDDGQEGDAVRNGNTRPKKKTSFHADESWKWNSSQ